jgi:hypothetical protein
MIEIAYLADHPEVIPTLVTWFQAQWPAYYAGRTPVDIAQDFFAEANRTGIPIRLVAFVDGTLAGTITLREQALQDFPEYQPGLGGLFVELHQRGRGTGSELVQAGMQVAQEIMMNPPFYLHPATQKAILVLHLPTDSNDMCSARLFERLCHWLGNPSFDTQ